MVRGTIIPKKGQGGDYGVLLGSKEVLMALLVLGYTRCLVSPQVVEKLAMRLRKLR